MLNVKELMVNNFIIYNNEVCAITNINSENISLSTASEVKLEDVTPIALSKVELEKLGFEIIKFIQPKGMTAGIDKFYGYDYAILRVNKGSGNSDMLTIRFKKDKYILEGFYGVRFTAVHQIQNLISIMNLNSKDSSLESKQLDVIDFINLGWIKSEKEFHGLIYFDIGSYQLSFYPPNPTFIEIDNDQNPFQKFIGTLNNKVELKVVMKQLGILK